MLAGLLLALVIGGEGFAAVSLGAELGALVMGLLLLTQPRAQELARALWGLKKRFPVGFFRQIGLSGLPDPGEIALALAVSFAFIQAAPFDRQAHRLSNAANRH